MPDRKPSLLRRIADELFAKPARSAFGFSVAGIRWLGIIGTAGATVIGLAALLDIWGVEPPGYQADPIAIHRGFHGLEPLKIGAYLNLFADWILGAALAFFALTILVSLFWFELLPAPAWLRRMKAARLRALAEIEADSDFQGGGPPEQTS